MWGGMLYASCLAMTGVWLDALASAFTIYIYDTEILPVKLCFCPFRALASLVILYPWRCPGLWAYWAFSPYCANLKVRYSSYRSVCDVVEYVGSVRRAIKPYAMCVMQKLS